MEFVTPVTTVAVLCCLIVTIAAIVVWRFIVPTPDSILNWMFWKSVEQETEDDKNYRNDLIRRGVTGSIPFSFIQ
jgi:hypothetical protein